jgi:hypothetical protein
VDDPFAPPAPSSTPDPDPFSPAPPPEPLAPSLDGSPDPFAAPQGGGAAPADPFAEAAADPFSAAMPRGTRDLAELLGVAPPAAGGLALEEREAPRPPEPSPLSYGEADLDLGLPELSASADVTAGAEAAPPPPPAPPVPPPAATPPPLLAPGSPATHAPTASASTPVPAWPSQRPAGRARRGAVAAALGSSASLVLLVGLAVALFVGWRTVRGSSLEARLHGALAAEPAGDVTPSAVTGGLYETAVGQEVLVVRGLVTVRAPVTGPVRVRVELVEGERVVAAATGAAGGVASPEQVHALRAPEDAAVLRAALDRSAPARLARGEAVPFMVVFPPPIPALSGVELRVRTDAAAGAAGRDRP